MEQNWKSELSGQGWSMIRSHSVRPSRFKVLGERASGTNFAVGVIQKNTDLTHVGPMEYGWKHGFPAMIGVAWTDLQVVIFRDAVSWVKSLYTKPWSSHRSMHSLDFPGFIRAEWNATVQKPKHWYELPMKPFNGVPLQMDRHPITGKPFGSVMQLRNAKCAAWLGMANRDINVVLARYEALRDDPNRFLDDLAHVYGIQANPTVVLPQKTLGSNYRMVDVQARRGEVEQISDFDRDLIVSELDQEQEAVMGYRY